MVQRIISALYRTLGRKILKFILKRNGGDMQAAEIILQDTFVSAFRSYHTFQHKSTYFTWLCKIALCKLSDYYRDQVNYHSRFFVPTARELNHLIDPAISADERLAMDELRQKLSECLDLLPPGYRQLLRLKYYSDLSARDICLKLHISPRSLEGKLYRARHALAAVVTRVHPDLKNL